LHFEFGPYDVLDVATAADGSITCLVRSFDHDEVDNPPLNLECMDSDVWHMGRAGWRREASAAATSTIEIATGMPESIANWA
jgi:hypothetical protein